jgi:CRISPR-associated endonuclease/helicase Cas3
MITDLAPADLILQRAGRLHRHEGRRRPPEVDRPRLWIGLPEDEADGSPSFDPGSEKVYFPHILIRSWLALHGRDAVTIPSDVEELIEAVYGENCPWELPDALRERWDKSLSDMREALSDERNQAERRYIRAPCDAEHLWDLVTSAREEEASQLHPALQALTRLTEPAVTVILLDRTPGGPVLHGDPVDLDHEVTTKQAADLLQRSVSLSDARVVHVLLQQEAPPGWRESALLRQCRAVLLSGDMGCEIGRYTLRLDPELGVVIE